MNRFKNLFEVSQQAATGQALVPGSLAAAVSLAWNDASVMKVPLGATQFNVQLGQSIAQLSSNSTDGPISTAMQLRPTVDMRTQNPMLIMGQGKLLDQYQLKAEDSRTWLKYAAPLIADATSAEGQASIELVGANVPLFDPMKSTVQGTLDVHNLTIGAGPLAKQLIPLIDQVRTLLKPGSSSVEDRTTWLQLKPQQIPVVVQQGRVHHQDFEMNYKDLLIRTRGSVGFDQTMDLIADIPIHDDWVQDNKLLATLKGKSISIPIQGTLNKPQLDRRVITQMTQQLVKDAAINAANERVTEEANKLKEKYGGRVQEELGRFQNKVNGKIETEVRDRIQNELRDGLKGLFGGDK